MNRSGAAGFTLIELLMVVVILAICVVMATSALKTLVQENRLIAQTNALTGFLHYGRSEAVKGGRPVTVCKSLDSTTCNTGSEGWENGWMVFEDPANGGVRDGGETLLRVQGRISGKLTIRNALARVTFTADGFSNGFADTWTLCDDRGVGKAAGVILSNAGSMATASDSNGDGVAEDHNGSNLTCP